MFKSTSNLLAQPGVQQAVQASHAIRIAAKNLDIIHLVTEREKYPSRKYRSYKGIAKRVLMSRLDERSVIYQK